MEHRAFSTDVILAGIRYVWSKQLLLGSISLDLFAVLLGGAVALMPIFAQEILHTRSEEHTSELQSRQYLVCRLLLEKKKNKIELENLRYSKFRCNLDSTLDRHNICSSRPDSHNSRLHQCIRCVRVCCTRTHTSWDDR